MNIKRKSLTFAVISLLPLLAHAESEEPATHASLLSNVLMGVLPLVLIGAFVWFVVRKTQKRGDDYVTTQKQHNDRVEQLLERIAKALEKD